MIVRFGAAQSAVKVLKEQLKCEQKKAKELRKGVQDDAAALAAKEAEQARLGDTFEKLRGEERRDADALQAAQKRFQQVNFQRETSAKSSPKTDNQLATVLLFGIGKRVPSCKTR